MKVDNPLSREFLLHYPVEAARTLEQLSVEHVAALYVELPPSLVAMAMASMLPEMAAACLDSMPPVAAAKLVAELPISSATRIFRRLSVAKQNEMSGHLLGKIRSQLHRHLVYPPQSAGALLDSRIDLLPQNITVAEALRRIERLDHAVRCEIYIINESHHLVGMIDLGRLLISSHHSRLRDIMKRKTQAISVHAPVQTLSAHPGWTKRYRLPVVERDNTPVGVLDYNTLRDSVSEIKAVNSRDPLENLLSLASLYWRNLAQLLDSLLGMAKSEKGKQQ